MGIGSYAQIQVPQGLNVQTGVLGLGARDKLEVREPLNPPSGWTKFKAALSNIPLVGELGTLKRARQEVESYPVRLGEYQATNRQLLAGLMKDLRSEYGGEIAEMTLRNMGVEDGAPLSLRTVTTALEGAKRAEQQCKSQNNQMVVRFLESPLQGGARLRGEQDMNDVFLDRGLKLGDAPGWQGAVGPGAQKFITQFIQARCQQLPEHAQGRVSNEQVVAAANDAFALYEELLTVPGMTPKRLGEIMEKSCEKDRPVEMATTAREMAIMDKVDPMLNRRDPGSFLSTEAAKLAREHGLPVPGDGVLKCIGNNVSEHVRVRSGDLQKDLGCEPGTSNVLTALRPQLEANVHKALDEHFKALKMIEGSTTLNEPQKALLRSIANERRIDPTQVAEYEKMAGKIGEALKAAGQLPGEPGRMIEALDGVLRQFEGSMRTMVLEGTSMWETASLKGGETMDILMGQFGRFAAAGMSQEDARALKDVLSGDAMKQFVQGIVLARGMALSNQFPTVLGTLIEGVALRSGMDAPSAKQLARDTVGVPDVPMHTLPPNLLLPVMTSDREMLDARGVAVGAKHGKEIAKGFRQGEVLTEKRDHILEYIGEDSVDETTGLSTLMVRDAGRARFQIGGQQVGPEKDKVVTGLRDAFPKTEDGAKMALAVSRCMNQLGINAFVEACNSKAYGEGTLIGTANAQALHEAWPQEDGSWIVRSTHTHTPAMIDRSTGRTQPQTEGVALYSLTYRVGPGKDEGGNPVIQLEGSTVAFDF